MFVIFQDVQLDAVKNLDALQKLVPPKNCSFKVFISDPLKKTYERQSPIFRPLFISANKQKIVFVRACIKRLNPVC